MNCPNCGAEVAANGRFCSGCGASTVPGTDIYSGFWRRVGAYLIDYALVLFAAIVFGVALGLTGFWSARIEVIAQLGMLVAYWLYATVMHSSERQATIGKLALRIKVTDYQGERISFGRANGRFFASILSSLTLGIGYLMAGFTRRRQALHDIVAGTLVVKNVASAGLVAQGAAARPMPAWAIVLLILVGALPSVGILAAIAVPAYADYRVRSQVIDGLAAASPYQQKVVEAVGAGRHWDDIDSAALGLPFETASPYLESIEVSGGAIATTFGAEAARSINPAQLALVPGLNEQGEVRWMCGYAPVPDGTEAALEEHEQYTNVPEKYLPSSCRGQAGEGSSED